LDKTESTQDKEDKDLDVTPEPEAKPPEAKKTTPEKPQKLYTEDDLRERGRDNATLTQRRKELDERETRIQEAEEKAKWNPVIEKYGQDKAGKIKEAGLNPDQIVSIAELLEIKVPPKVPTVDSGDTSGGGEKTEQQKLDERFPTMKK